ncbi:MazG-like family protein [Fodinisporobacter ferrooxydans]|uniref:MazG-like family protein n=1 Tax=Fodinisporobacter ferrooxydans TaxID=2901836 RepID=A0ABY4CQ81_9BACL|nr:MazG-like family protein [Alicyclobacillaceae bacterium MYW30-H2]
MPNFFRELDIGKNIKAIEWLKAELLDNTAGLFRAFLKGNEEILTDYLSNIVILAYTLGRRLGIGYKQLDQHMLDKLTKNTLPIQKNSEWYGDLSEFKEHIGKR